jgi:hypothetical protein
MRNFDYDNNDEYRDEVDRFFDDDDDALSMEEYRAIVEQENIQNNINYKIVQNDLNHKKLLLAIRLLKSSFWWKFYSLNTRLYLIEKVYKKFISLGQEEELEEDDL